jgi:hypothetical protein
MLTEWHRGLPTARVVAGWILFTLDIDNDAKLFFYRHRQFNAIQLVGVAEANCDIRFGPTAINFQRRCEWQWLVFVAET